MAAGSDDENESFNLDEEDYYAFLNVRKDATNEELSVAYRRLSRLYHPDKHTDPVKKKQAELLFTKTKNAYEILTDPHKRAIYDNLGVKGLQVEGWEVVQWTKTPQEIREEYERLARIREEHRLQQRTNPKGLVTVHVNATELFNPYAGEYLDENGDEQYSAILALPEVSGISFSQSTEIPLTTLDTTTLSGNLSTHHGSGSGTVACAFRHLSTAKRWWECEFGVGEGPQFTTRLFQHLSSESYITLSGTFQVVPNYPGIHDQLLLRYGGEATLTRRLGPHTMGFLSWKAGIQNCMNTMVIHDTKESHMNFSIEVGIPHSYVLFSYKWKFPEQEMKLNSVIKAGTFGFLCQFGAEKKISQHSILSSSLFISTISGISVKLRLLRGSQTYTMIIHLCDDIETPAIFYGSVTPLLLYYAMKVLLINPYIKQQTAKELEKQRELNKTKLAEKKREAESAIELMQETVHRIKEQETGKHGLVIVIALYGKLVDSESMETLSSEESIVDVTIPLQCQVNDSKLILHESSKSQLAGFYDPCPGEEKSLKVRYMFRDHLHECTVSDTDTLRLPKPSHKILNT